MLSLIGSSWNFFRRQPALLWVGIWLLFVPMLCIDALTSVVESDAIPADTRAAGTIAIFLLSLVLSVIIVWGQCCVMVAGRRMLQTNAGRSRTSFGAVSSQAKAFVIPFILTNLLRGCITLLWSLLLVIPGIIYAIRTAFAPVVIVGENVAYRGALKRSKDAVKGNFWPVTGTLLGVLVLLFLVPFGIITGLTHLLPDTPAVSVASRAVGSAWSAVATILVNLCLIRMYEQYRKPAHR